MKWLYNKKYPIILYVATLVIFGISSVDVPYPEDFVLEHVLTVLFMILLAATYRKFRLSNISYTMIFIFMVLHIIGAHYTYSEVPYNSVIQNWFGFNVDQFFGFTRNMYDRLVHFSFGLLFAYPAREVFNRFASAKGIWGLYFPLDVMAALSMVYELLEYGIVLLYGAGGVGASYLGSQGDIWDAQKDMFLATLGAFIAMTTVAIVNIKLNPGFWQEIKDSLKLKHAQPLGEVEIQAWADKAAQ